MKRLHLVFFTLVISSLSVFGQGIVDNSSTGNNPMNPSQVHLPTGNSWEAQHFREALLRGREYKGYYVLINDEKRKVVKIESLISFCRANNYIWKNKYETKEVPKFGDVATSVYKFSFIPVSEYVQYVFEWTDRFQKRSSDLKNRGAVYFFDYSFHRFTCLEGNALWTGNVLDGYVDGTGAGIWQKDNTHYYYFCGTFRRGFPIGKVKYRVVEVNPELAWGYSPREKTNLGNWGTGAPFREVEVGEMHDGMALFRYLDNGEGHSVSINELYGYVKQDGEIVIWPKYKSAFDFTGDRAIVKNDQDQEIYIDRTGQFIDYTANQRRINEQEEIRKREEQRQREIREQRERQERQRLAAEAEKRRVEKIKKCEPGDRIYFSQEWEHTDNWILFTTTHSYNMRVICFVEQNIKNGERLQIRVGSVESSSDRYYSTPKIDGIEYRKGDVLWIKPLQDTRWQIE